MNLSGAFASEENSVYDFTMTYKEEPAPLKAYENKVSHGTQMESAPLCYFSVQRVLQRPHSLLYIDRRNDFTCRK